MERIERGPRAAVPSPSDLGPFTVLAEPELRELDSRLARVPWRAQEEMPEALREGEGILVVRSGRLALLGRTAYGQTMMLALISPGAIMSNLGEMVMPDAVAIQDSVVSPVPRRIIEVLASRRPAVALAIMEALSERAALLRGVAADVGEMLVEDRLWARLCHFAEELGIATSDGARLEMELTHADWGMLTGASREAISQAFGRLRGKGLVVADARDRRALLIPWDAFGKRASTTG
jgi:CRP-like cAMP-binding protein